MKPASNKADGIRMTLIDGLFMPIFLFFMSLVIDPFYKKRLNEIVPVSHPIFWFGTILTQKSNNKNYSNNAKTNQVELISSCYHDIIQTKRARLRYLFEFFLDKLLQTHSLQILRFLEN